ncbi:hypothetical protein CMUS01_15615 [Colletotrichum musicola]|uniref:Uncharacterized protein n=1 Tax=Colletotrichum musicola TaxID=2175873 RepID=A0A8H6MLM7_9PEZI|nr:hypothetical protein CMUS01_15615 [Colletotrichum musicola]
MRNDETNAETKQNIDLVLRKVFWKRWDGLETFSMSVLKWWLDPTQENLILVPSAVIVTIKSYTGQADIFVDDLGFVPFEALPDIDRQNARDRMTERGKRHVETFRNSPHVVVWNYQGPARRPQFWRGWLPGSADNPWSPSAEINCRVIIQDDYTRSLMNPRRKCERMPINDATPTNLFMTCNNYINVRTLSKLEEVLVPCDGLKPATWTDVSPGSHVAWVANAISEMTRNFDKQREKVSVGVGTHSPNLLFVIRVDDKTSSIALGDVAESLQKPFVLTDILDHLTEDNDPLEGTEQILRLAGPVSALVCLQNAAPLIERRSFDHPKRCRQVTGSWIPPQDILTGVLIQVVSEEFRRLLERFQVILFLCLEEDDEIDPSFEKLGLVHIRPEKNLPS